MAWIESHVELGTHPKTFELMTALEIGKPAAVGLLTLLWHFTMQFSWKDGDLSKFSDAAIATWLGWDGDPKKLIQGLEQTRWLENKRVHDWLDYAGKLVKDRIYNQERRKTATNDDKRRNTPSNDVSARKIGATVPYPTVPYQKTKNSPTPDGAAAPEPNRPKIKTTPELEPTTPFWHHTIDHLRFAYAKKKFSANGRKETLFIPGKVLPELKNLMRIYPAAQTMALWDVYLASESDYARKRGYSVATFLQMIDQLVDDPKYKPLTLQYEGQLMDGLPADIQNLLGHPPENGGKRRETP